LIFDGAARSNSDHSSPSGRAGQAERGWPAWFVLADVFRIAVGRYTGRILWGVVAVKLPLWVWVLANGAAGLVLALLLIDPTRDLRPVLALLAVAVGTLLVLRRLHRGHLGGRTGEREALVVLYRCRQDADLPRRQGQ
jgi:hypothetical protein